MRIGLGLACLLTTTLSLGCGDDSPAGDDTGSETGESSGSTTAMTTASTMPMTSDGTSTGPGESSGDSTAGPGESTTSGTSDGDSTTAGSDSGGTEPLYPPCAPDMDPVCPEPYLACYDFAPGYSACTSPCENAGDCPVPDTGDAEVVCAGMMMNQCLLDCSGGATCPDGMECVPVAGGMFNRCLWPDM